LDFEEALVPTEGIICGVTEREALVPYDLVKDARSSTSGTVLEIGSYTGKCAIILSATASIYAIDHHRGNAERQRSLARSDPRSNCIV